ncbi:MAG: hypothetical protein Kow00121_11740 [Elainellaceae cyanobacterium]
MIFYLSILTQSQNQKPDPEISDTPPPLKQGLQVRYHQATVKDIHQKTRANYFLERRLLA